MYVNAVVCAQSYFKLKGALLELLVLVEELMNTLRTF